MACARRISMTIIALVTVGTLSSFNAAAAQSSTTRKDSAAADSAAPKKRGRFGGMMDKAKSVASNSAVGAAAKGAAKNVACTVVPLGAVSAATGTGPCAGTGLIANLMGASGQLNLLGLSNANAQAAALQLMRGAGANGMSNAAAQAAAMQLMTQNGMSNAVANATLANMLSSQALAGSVPGDAAAAQKIIQAMGLVSAGAQAGGIASKLMSLRGRGGNNAAAAPGPAPVVAPTLWVNYDFVPGNKVIYYQDFTDDKVGNFPARLDLVEGNMEIAELGGVRVMRATSASTLDIKLPEVLPQRFTIEMDVINRPSLDGADFHLRGSAGRVDDATTSIIGWGSDGVAVLGGGGGEVKLVGSEANRRRYRGKPAHLRIMGDGKYVKVYVDEKRLANVPNANFEHSKILHLFIDARSEENPAYVTRIRVATGSKSMFEDLASSGRAATQGLLFDNGSDVLLPESAPTIAEIAATLKDHPDLRLRIEGYTDNVGESAANKALSEKRALAVKTAMITQYQIDAKRLDSKGFGAAKPIAPNTTAEGRATNRRVELVKM